MGDKFEVTCSGNGSGIRYALATPPKTTATVLAVPPVAGLTCGATYSVVTSSEWRLICGGGGRTARKRKRRGSRA